MLTRAESLKKSGFIPKETFTPGSRPSSPASKFRYFGDDSQVSSLASLYYKKSQKLLGTRFTDSSFKLSTISRIDNQSNPLRQKGGYVEKVGERVKENKRTQAKAVGHPPMSEDKSEISEIQSMKSQSVSNLKEEMGELNGRLKNLEGLLSTLASSEIKTREEIRSLRKCVSEKSLGKEDFSKYKMPSYPNPMLYSNSNISETLTQNPGIRRDLKRKVKQCECHCTGTKEREKEQMSGIIFQLYEENKFYENQLSKMGELKKSSVLKNKARINQLLSKIRNV